MTATAILALGSNLGDREDTLVGAIGDLAGHSRVEVAQVSPVAVTVAVGGPAKQPHFLNLVLEVETGLGPLDLLRHCQSVEAGHHRVREVHWGPRTLDIDIIDYSDVRMNTAELTLPHPLASRRAFVLAPWARMDPTARLDGRPVSRLAKDAPDSGGILEFRRAPVVVSP